MDMAYTIELLFRNKTSSCRCLQSQKASRQTIDFMSKSFFFESYVVILQGLCVQIRGGGSRRMYDASWEIYRSHIENSWGVQR